MKRIALSLFLIAGFALPAAAETNPCNTVTIDQRADGNWYIAGRDHQEGAPRAALVGGFVWFAFNGPSGFDATDTLSFDAEGLESATACADGSVSLVEVVSDAGVSVNPPSAPAPTPATLRPVCDVYADTLVYVCTLPNLTLRVS